MLLDADVAGPLLDVHINYTVNLPPVKVEVYCQIRKMCIIWLELLRY
jgi:hypothetical protein